MQIARLRLEDFRGASSLALDLHDRLNVFVGMNGAGKSTVLDAAAILLSWLVNRIKHQGSSGRPVSESDIKNGRPTATLTLWVRDDSRAYRDSKPYEWKLVKSRKGHGSPQERSTLQELSELAKSLQSQISESSGQANLPLLVYYPVNRAVLDIPLRIRERHRFDTLAAYDESLTSGANFRTFFEWFREREDLENENRKYLEHLVKPDGFVFPDPQLQAVRSALTQFLPEFTNLTFRRNPLRMEVEKAGQKLTVNQLSDGEKCLMAMIGDLARRMAIANPGAADLLNGTGVVLIDEIDLHLHARWQRMVVPQLSKVFPNCQFLVSTHSPHVITHVRPENLYLLTMTDKDMEAGRPNESYGKNVDRVLEDLMGLETTRPNPVSAELQGIYEQIDKGRLDAARESIGRLREAIGEDPELVKASVFIRRKELVGR